MNNPKMQELKQWLKDTGKLIRRLKIQHKENQRKGKNDWKEQGYLDRLRWEYRNRHIAYSELRGRTREQIEPTLKEDTPKPDEDWIADIKEEVEAARVEEDAA